MNFSANNLILYTVYMEYKDQQPCWPLIGCALFLSIFAFFGIVFNSALIYVTFRTRTLNGPTNHLLAFNAALEIMHQTSHFTFLFFCLTGQTFIDYKLAAKIGAISIFGYSGVFPAMLCTAIDRLIAVAFPFFYKVKQQHYLSGFIILICSFGSYSVVITFITAESMPNVQMTAFEADLYQGPLAVTRKNSIFGMLLCTILINIITGLLIHKKKSTNVTTMTAADKANRKIFKSLCLVIFVHIGGFLLMYIYGIFLMPILIQNSLYLLTWYGVILSAIPLNISSISIAPILFFSSSGYRNAFTNEWRRLLSLVCLQPLKRNFANTVVPAPTPMMMNSQTRSQILRSTKF